MLKLRYFDPNFSIREMNENRPSNDMVLVNGLTVPLSSIPFGLQQILKGERAEGRDIEFKTQ